MHTINRILVNKSHAVKKFIMDGLHRIELMDRLLHGLSTIHFHKYLEHIKKHKLSILQN